MRHLLTLLTCAATCGCGPTILDFSAAPQAYCAGDAVQLSWDTSGAEQVTLETIPPGGDARPIAGSGATVVAAETRTYYRLTASNPQGSISAETRTNFAGGGPHFRFAKIANLECVRGSYPSEVIFAISDASPQMRIVNSSLSHDGLEVTELSPAPGARLLGSIWRIRPNLVGNCPLTIDGAETQSNIYRLVLNVEAECAP